MFNVIKNCCVLQRNGKLCCYAMYGFLLSADRESNCKSYLTDNYEYKYDIIDLSWSLNQINAIFTAAYN